MNELQKIVMLKNKQLEALDTFNRPNQIFATIDDDDSEFVEKVYKASEDATEAKQLAQEALEHAVSGAGTKVYRDGVVLANFNADTKADISYVDQKVADLVGSAPDTLDTLDELANALKDNADIVTVLENSIANKADKTDLDNYVTLTSEQNISGLKYFDTMPKVYFSDRYRDILTSPIAYQTDKRYLLGIDQLGAKYTNANASVYMQNGKLYSNNEEVTTAGSLSNYLPLSGGTMTGPIKISGGDGVNAANIQLATDGQITDGATATLFGRTSGGSTLIVGHGNFTMNLRGSTINASAQFNASNDIIGGTSNNKGYHGYITSPATARLESLNFEHKYWSSSNSGQPLVRVDEATGSCKEGKPASDGYVMTWMWDNTGVYNTQFFLPNGTGTKPQIRNCTTSGWSTWRNFAMEGTDTTFTSINLTV